MTTVSGSCTSLPAPVTSGDAGTPGPSPAPSGENDTEAPVITLMGNNPAEITVGTAYADLGALVSDNVDQNLGLKAIVDGADVGDPGNIAIDTSGAGVHEIEYYATDQAGNRGSAIREVQVTDPFAVATTTPPDSPSPDITESTTGGADGVAEDPLSTGETATSTDSTGN